MRTPWCCRPPQPAAVRPRRSRRWDSCYYFRHHRRRRRRCRARFHRRSRDSPAHRRYSIGVRDRAGCCSRASSGLSSPLLPPFSTLSASSLLPLRSERDYSRARRQLSRLDLSHSSRSILPAAFSPFGLPLLSRRARIRGRMCRA